MNDVILLLDSQSARLYDDSDEQRAGIDAVLEREFPRSTADDRQCARRFAERASSQRRRLSAFLELARVYLKMFRATAPKEI